MTRRPMTSALPARIALACALALFSASACSGSHGDAVRPGGAGGAGARRAVKGPARVVVVSLDGLIPETYLEPDRLGLAVPTLRALASRGAYARAVESVFPSVTYPAHTTLVTGAPPRVHGITSNRTVDPLHKNQSGWRWYAEDIAVPTLWQVVEAQGRAAALIQWPVTVGAQVSFNVPEFWRAGTRDDQKLLRGLSTPGLLEAVARGYPELWTALTPPDVRDPAQFAIAKHLIAHESPDLMLVHVWMTDDAQHAHGPRSAEAKQAIENVDRLLGELVAVLEQSPDWPRTTLVIYSDHGFAAVDKEIRLNALFVERGLIQLDAEGKPATARVTAIENGGTAYVYALDEAARGEVRAALDSIRPALAQVYTPEEIAAAGGDPEATFAVAGAPGHSFSDKLSGPVIAERPGRGHHGFPPKDPAMAASFIAYGPRVPRRDLGAVKMVDLGPTIARWLGVTLPGATGTAIPGL